MHSGQRPFVRGHGKGSRARGRRAANAVDRALPAGIRCLSDARAALCTSLSFSRASGDTTRSQSCATF